MKEPNLIKKIKNLPDTQIENQKKVLVLSILCMVILLLSSSYAMMKNFDKTDDVVEYQIGELAMSILNGEKVFSLLTINNIPESDEDGLLNATAIPITIKNTGTLEVGIYNLMLVADPTKTTTMNLDYIKYSVSLDGGTTYLIPVSLGKNDIIYSGEGLKPGESKTFYLKIWASLETPNSEMGKVFNGSLSLDFRQTDLDYKVATNVITDTLVPYATSSQTNFSGGLVAINTDGTLYNETDTTQTIREYRYSGLNVNNYIYFNCKDTDSNSKNYGDITYDYKNNCEIWRIIGVFTEQNGERFIKIMRNTTLTVEEIPETYVYNDYTYTLAEDETSNTATWNSGSIDDWNGAGLQYFLNTEQDINGTKGYLNSLSTNAKQLTRNTIIYLGEAGYYGTFKTFNMYRDERYDDNFWNGSVSLLYPSDVGYALNNSDWTDAGNASLESSWVFQNANHSESEWLISPCGFYPVAISIWPSTSFFSFTVDPTGSAPIRPTMHLKSNTDIILGNGTSKSPYVITLR